MNILEETKRHNQVMERLRNLEKQNNLELTKRQIEIQDIKWKKKLTKLESDIYKDCFFFWFKYSRAE